MTLLLYAIHSATIIYSAITLVKMLEMAYHNRLVNEGVQDHWKTLPITTRVSRMPAIHFVVYRIHVQIITLSVLGYFIQNRYVSWLALGVIITALWFLIGRMLQDLLHAGTNRYLSSLGAPNFLAASNPHLNNRQRIQSFAKSIISLVGLTVFAYGAIYRICHIQFNRTAFSGIPNDGFDMFYFIYYSLVTFATVGYGDIYPAGPSTCTTAHARLLTRAFVSSEICFSFIVVAVFVVSYSLAFGNDASSDELNTS